MSVFEIIIIASAVSIPVIALLMVIPKFKRRQKLISHETMPYVSSENESPVVNKTVDQDQKETTRSLQAQEDSTDEFKDYLRYKKESIVGPTKKELPEGYIDRTSPYVRRRMDKNKEHKTIIEQINTLSPELLTMMLSGIFDKKTQ